MIKNNYPIIRPSLDLNFAGSKTVDPRITFTRASTATYYDGKTVAKAEENLLLSSNNLTLAGLTETTRTNNYAVAPDGTTTAFTLIPNTNNTLHLSGSYSASNIAALSGENTVLSFYAKASGYKNLRLGNGLVANCFVTYDLDALSVSGTGGANFVSATIVDAGSGWRRLTVVYNSTATPFNFGFCPFPDGATVDNFGRATFAGDGTSGMFFWGFQAERRSNNTATAYTPTTDQPITRYQPVLLTAPANTPRIDHDPITGECKGLLIEESRTNLLTYSEQFDNAAWDKKNSSVSANVTVAPDGTLTADFVKETSGEATGHFVASSAVTAQAGSYTGSVYVKAGSRNWCIVRFGYQNAGVFVNLTDGSVGSNYSAALDSVSVKNVGNGWYKVSITKLMAAGNLGLSVDIATANNVNSYVGDGYSGIYVWGAQLETGAFPTSYIKTEASQVTRAADNASMTGTNFSSWYRQDAFTLTADVAPIGGAYSHAVSINNGLDQRALALQYCASTGAIIRQAETYVAPTSYSPIPARAKLSRGSRTKVAASFKVGGYANNSFDGDIALGAIQIPRLPEHSVLRFGNFYIPGTVAWTGHIRRVTGYPIDLSPTNLQALTL